MCTICLHWAKRKSPRPLGNFVTSPMSLRPSRVPFVLNTFRIAALVSVALLWAYGVEEHIICEPVDDVKYEEGDREQISGGAINLLGGYMPLDDEFIHVYWRWMLMFCIIFRRCRWFDWFHRRLQDTHTRIFRSPGTTVPDGLMFYPICFFSPRVLRGPTTDRPETFPHGRNLA